MPQYRVCALDDWTWYLFADSEDEAIETIAAIYRIRKSDLQAAPDSPYLVAPQVIQSESGETSVFSRRGSSAIANFSITYEPLNRTSGVRPRTITKNAGAEAWSTVRDLQRSDEKVVVRRFGREISWQELRDEAEGKE